ncbi:hypothetical protein PVAP13_7NG400000 [Panicum virgatum]|uniref:Peroxisomal ATPase PEX6 n=1 Tax=Panicum virgatum TaxID=38727 RepID=A0A8T0QF22_PANVG|nr:hypothetical protein PVAP13_7NG400000 [Panicum virgatum]
MVERRQRRKPLVLASTQALLDSLPGDRPPPPPQEPVRLRAGVLRFPSGGGAEFGELASFVALPAPALRRLAVVTGTPLLMCRCFSRMLTIMSGGLLKQYYLITHLLMSLGQNRLIMWPLPLLMVMPWVTSMEPSDEPILRVNCNETALVLGGAASAAIPPYSFFAASGDSLPLHGEIVEHLASIIAPALCPSDILTKIKFSTFIYGPSGCGKRTVVRHVANHLGLHVVECSCHDLMTSSESGAPAALATAFKESQKYSPCIILLRHFDAIGKASSNEGPESEQSGIASNIESVIKQYTGQHWVAKDSTPGRDVNGSSIILVATADSSEGMQQSIRRCFRHEIDMKTVNEEKRKKLISETLQGIATVADESMDDKFIKDLAAQTSGFMPRDILALVADVGVSFAHKIAAEKDCKGISDHEEILPESSSASQNEEKHFCKEDILSSLERAKKRNRAALGTPKVPNVKWEDVGGLEEVKKVILDTIQLPLMYKHLFSSKLRKRSGVLLYGPPGTGKTLLAKAVATECSLNFLSVKGPELINMYVGESEKNVRDIFEKARSARPCVIFFDELDSLAPARGSSADSGGVMDRVVSQLLVEIDGLSDNSQDLFIIGATNRPDLLDSALLRPGRFDKLLYVGVNTDASYRERILRAQTRKYRLHDNVSLLSVAQRCPPNFTGADIYALCADAWFHAAKRSVKTFELDPSRNNDAGAEEVIVEIDDFMTVLGDISPSLSLEELQNYEQLRQKIEGPSR